MSKSITWRVRLGLVALRRERNSIRSYRRLVANLLKALLRRHALYRSSPSKKLKIRSRTSVGRFIVVEQSDVMIDQADRDPGLFGWLLACQIISALFRTTNTMSDEEDQRMQEDDGGERVGGENEGRDESMEQQRKKTKVNRRERDDDEEDEEEDDDDDDDEEDDEEEGFRRKKKRTKVYIYLYLTNASTDGPGLAAS